MPERSSEPHAPARRRLYVVATVHLDSQWRWTIQQTIREFLPATLAGNFELFERFPFFVLSFEGGFRYALIKEYYPEAFERLKGYVAEGRWRPAGSMLDAPDVNIPSPESLLRHILYGNRFFERELGCASRDLFLPDCFGFGHALPSIAAHCGLAGFSAQKFGKWGAPAELPFEIGYWQGPDGNGVVAALRPEGYGEGLDEDLSRARRFVERIDAADRRSGVAVAYKYVGIGDRGGALPGEAVEWIGKSLAGTAEGAPIQVVHGGSDQLFRDLSAEEVERLPRHRGELLLPTHGTGCLTSQAALKRWNRANELLADAAERAAVAAELLGLLPYPRRRLTAAWTRFLWHQMHDDLTGTSIPPAYGFSWNDALVALNQFADVLTAAVGAVASRLDTRGAGTPLVVYNPLSIRRQDLAAARLKLPPGTAAVRVFDPRGAETPSQCRRTADGATEVLFLAKLPALGFAVYDLRPSATGCDLETGLRVTGAALENERYRAVVDDNGDLARLFDKRLGADLLSAPAGVELLPDRSTRWPAWEVRWRDVVHPRPERLRGPAEIRVVERGPARVALEVRRRARGSSFVQRLRLVAGVERLEIDNRVDWRTRGRLAKAVFPLSCPAATATFDLGWGVIARGNRRPDKYEVPAQQWADLSSDAAGFGVAVLTDSKYGWDKPNDGTLRLTLLRSPRVVRKFRHQGVQDHGHHRFVYSLHGHAGDWREEATRWQAARLNQPPFAFRTAAHAGPLGRVFSLGGLSTSQVAVAALKKAEEGDEVVVRLLETAGRPVVEFELELAGGVAAARELDGTERPLASEEDRRGSPPTVREGRLVARFDAFQARTLALELVPPSAASAMPRARPLTLPHDIVATGPQDRPSSGGFDARGRTFPAELFPESVTRHGVEHRLGPGDGANCLACRGQRIELGRDPLPRLHLLAASAAGTRSARFTLGPRTVEIEVPHYAGFIGRWKAWRRWPRGGRWGRPGSGFLQRQPIAWIATHRHDRDGRDEPYVFCYLFAFVLELPPGAASVALPDDPAVRLFAATLSDEPFSATEPARPLYE